MTRIVVFRFSSMGDVAITVPILVSVLEQNPELEIYFFSRKQYKDLFTSIDRLHFVGIDFEDDYKGILGLYKISRTIRNLKPNFIADLHNVLRTKIIRFFLFDIKKSVLEKGRKERKQLITYPNKVFKPLKSISKRYAEVFENLNLEAYQNPILKNHLPFVTQNRKKGIGVAPFAAFSGKIYPLEYMEWIVWELAKLGHSVFLFGGGKDEQKILSAWAEKKQNITNFAGKFSLSEELQKIANLEIMLCMDSANMHLASLVGTRVLSVWGATHPFAGFLGYGQSIDDCIQRLDLDCRPCSIYGEKDCKICKYKCLEIPKELVLEKVQKAIER